ncbi:MAG: glycosyltransferase [Xanthobacteraceae bacterium]|nr:glycosyltransferase [Xanthobacteraceae bacterium]
MDGIPTVPKISFVVAMHDHAEDFGRHVDSLVDQTLSPSDYEIVFADSCHVLDLRRELERAHARKDPRLQLRYERVSKGGRATAINGGVRLAQARIILLFAHDAIAPRDTAEVHLRFHQENPERNRVGAGSLLVPPALRSRFITWLEQSGELFGAPFRHDMTSVPENFFYIAHCSIKRDFLLETGLFDENFPAHAWDDFELGCRLSARGMKSSYVGVAAEHDHNITMRDRRRSMLEAGEGAAVFDRKYGGHQPWHNVLRQPRRRLRLKALRSLFRYAWSRREDHLIAYYRARLNAAFVTGYQRANGPVLARAAAASPPPCVKRLSSATTAPALHRD